MTAHTPRPVIVAELWRNGQIIACWTTEKPGVTGPAHLVDEVADPARRSALQARGWTFRVAPAVC